MKEKIAFLRGWIHDAEKIKEVAPDFGDIEPYDDRLNQPFGVLYKEQHFE